MDFSGLKKNLDFFNPKALKLWTALIKLIINTHPPPTRQSLFLIGFKCKSLTLESVKVSVKRLTCMRGETSAICDGWVFVRKELG